jgi:hypothetical protein
MKKCLCAAAQTEAFVYKSSTHFNALLKDIGSFSGSAAGSDRLLIANGLGLFLKRVLRIGGLPS